MSVNNFTFNFRCSIAFLFFFKFKKILITECNGENNYRPVHNGTINFANKIKTIDHINLILSGIHIHPRPHVPCKFSNDILRNKATVMILVKEAKIV